ncbi:SymE family type I addiction module toxin [Phytopseudomonas dryadis]|uniref:Type I toxin-antitoxin system SymE family toxin n=1 Tax=Phytopseudomonas dryadis TaxID=2487520 RepID=A0ABY1Z8H3_9GAMM|nr:MULTISPECIES: SymE family type I addiction module toxin [Pseudomonas]TBV07648.1 type I toxin-antitoxin system SymE family toxin [Pseudomonas dryadis]TBV19924.1 type I toxin-antitoxin system SymE family toxin [Pseudomonas sp. FRB 230]
MTAQAVFPLSRQLTIGYTYYECRNRNRWPLPPPVPFLRLQGYWLQQAGFAIGQRVCIQVSEQRLIIIPSEI